MDSLARQAMENLKRQFFTAADIQADRLSGFGWNEKPYLMVCHGCGTYHVVRSAFISSPLAIGFSFADKSSLSIPCYKCPTCPSSAIREAWEKGTKPEVYKRAAQTLGIATVTR